MAAILPYHTTAREYTNKQTHVYHDRGDCMEGQRIDPMHWTDGHGGRLRCKECARLETVEHRNTK